ncbi:MAG: DUF503 domain-containing protein [Anaerolineae bacterium]|nr:DUF503 domain-containing protein [Anaerolineae bacterium]
MVIGVCTIELDIPGCHSLKEKRGILKPLLARLHREFNVSAAEVDLHDVWQSAAIAVAVISTANGHADRTLQRVVQWIEDNRPEVQVVAERFELIH